MIDFSDLEGDLNAADGAKKATGTVWSNPCPKCRGTGIFRGYSGQSFGQCFMCKGKGVLTFTTSPEQRERDRAARYARKAAKADEAIEAFKMAHPEHFAWIARNPHFSFATSMREAITKYGDLTANQLSAIERCIEKDAMRQAEKIAKVEQAATVDLSRIHEIFANARAASLKKPKLRVGDITLSLASETSRNAGAIYVKRGEAYLGKVADSKFSPSRECRPDDIELVRSVAADPLGLAVAYGRRTGNCACCGRLLTDKESVKRGIGPICASKWGM